MRALGAFGNAADRSALLAASTDAAQPQFASLALAGLSAARGDEAALELASAAEAGADPRRAELGLAALCSVAAAKHGGLSPAVRAQCADALERSLEDPKSPEQTRARRRCALAALDPARAPR